MFWNALLACVDPVSPVGIVGTPPNPPVTSPTGPQLPIAPTLTVEPLVAAASTAIEVLGADPSASVTVWRGTFGGSSCPSELGGSCLPIGGAEVATTGTADAAGTLAT